MKNILRGGWDEFGREFRQCRRKRGKRGGREREKNTVEGEREREGVEAERRGCFRKGKLLCKEM